MDDHADFYISKTRNGISYSPPYDGRRSVKRNELMIDGFMGGPLQYSPDVQECSAQESSDVTVRTQTSRRRRSTKRVVRTLSSFSESDDNGETSQSSRVPRRTFSPLVLPSALQSTPNNRVLGRGSGRSSRRSHTTRESSFYQETPGAALQSSAGSGLGSAKSVYEIDDSFVNFRDASSDADFSEDSFLAQLSRSSSRRINNSLYRFKGYTVTFPTDYTYVHSSSYSAEQSEVELDSGVDSEYLVPNLQRSDLGTVSTTVTSEYLETQKRSGLLPRTNNVLFRESKRSFTSVASSYVLSAPRAVSRYLFHTISFVSDCVQFLCSKSIDCFRLIVIDRSTDSIRRRFSSSEVAESFLRRISGRFSRFVSRTLSGVIQILSFLAAFSRDIIRNAMISVRHLAIAALPVATTASHDSTESSLESPSLGSNIEDYTTRETYSVTTTTLTSDKRSRVPYCCFFLPFLLIPLLIPLLVRDYGRLLAEQVGDSVDVGSFFGYCCPRPDELRGLIRREITVVMETGSSMPDANAAVFSYRFRLLSNLTDNLRRDLDQLTSTALWHRVDSAKNRLSLELELLGTCLLGRGDVWKLRLDACRDKLKIVETLDPGAAWLILDFVRDEVDSIKDQQQRQSPVDGILGSLQRDIWGLIILDKKDQNTKYDIFVNNVADRVANLKQRRGNVDLVVDDSDVMPELLNLKAEVASIMKVVMGDGDPVKVGIDRLRLELLHLKSLTLMVDDQERVADVVHSVDALHNDLTDSNRRWVSGVFDADDRKKLIVLSRSIRQLHIALDSARGSVENLAELSAGLEHVRQLVDSSSSNFVELRAQFSEMDSKLQESGSCISVSGEVSRIEGELASFRADVNRAMAGDLASPYGRLVGAVNDMESDIVRLKADLRKINQELPGRLQEIAGDGLRAFADKQSQALVDINRRIDSVRAKVFVITDDLSTNRDSIGELAEQIGVLEMSIASLRAEMRNAQMAIEGSRHTQLSRDMIDRLAAVERNMSGVSSSILNLNYLVTTNDLNISSIFATLDKLLSKVNQLSVVMDTIKGEAYVNVSEVSKANLVNDARSLERRADVNKQRIHELAAAAHERTVDRGPTIDPTLVETQRKFYQTSLQNMESEIEKLRLIAGGYRRLEESVDKLTQKSDEVAQNIALTHTELGGIDRRLVKLQDGKPDITLLREQFERLERDMGRLGDLGALVDGIKGQLADLTATDAELRLMRERISLLNDSIQTILGRSENLGDGHATLTSSMIGLASRLSELENVGRLSDLRLSALEDSPCNMSSVIHEVDRYITEAVQDAISNKSSPFIGLMGWIHGSDTDRRRQTIVHSIVDNITNVAHVPPCAETVSTGDIRLIVSGMLRTFAADQTGMADYALESQGGSVESTGCSETYHRHSARWSLFGIPLWNKYNSPRTVIMPGMNPGECWAFKGQEGFLVVRLSGVVALTHVSVEHIPRKLSPTGEIDSAPRLFSVSGFNGDYTEGDSTVIGSFAYNRDGEPLQTFPVDSKGRSFTHVELNIHSNHGNPEYTCLYRFRVHGSLVSYT